MHILDLGTWNISCDILGCFSDCISLIYLNIENWRKARGFAGYNNLSLIKCRQDTFEKFKHELMGEWIYENGYAIKCGMDEE